MNSALRIAVGLSLPIEMVGESTAILAKKGAGKSNTAKVIVEETLDHGGVQVIVLDPIGHWWSLRAGANGKPGGGYPVAVFGGMHGDLPLEETAGKVLAQTAVDSGQPIVLDVSSLDSNGAMQRFVYEFFEELYRLKQQAPTPTLLVLEEADEFAPQDPKGANVPRMVGAANRISKRGRGRGIGMLYVTQRSAALNKNVLDQSDTLIVMRTIGPRDRAAIEGWVKHQDAAGMDEVLPSLPTLETGEAWIWAPERQLLKRVKIRKARTFDSSATPRAGQTAVVATVKPINVDELGAAIAATVERAKANDPAELRKQLRELEQRVKRADENTARLEALLTERPDVEAAVVEVSPFAPIDLEDAQNKVSELRAQLAEAVDGADDALGELAKFSERLMQFPKTKEEACSRSRSTSPPPAGAAVSGGSRSDLPAAAPVATAPSPAGATLGARTASSTPRADGAPEQRILDALAWYEALGIRSPSKIAVGFLSGYRVDKKLGGNYGKALGLLRSEGLVEYPGRGDVSLTDDGRAAARDPGIEHSNEAFRQAVYARLEPAEIRILEHLIEAYPQPIGKVDLGLATGYRVDTKLGGNYGKALGKLRMFGLIDYPARGVAVALPVLFPEDAA